MEIKQKNYELDLPEIEGNSLIIIPERYCLGSDEGMYSSTSISFMKDIGQKIPVEFLVDPKSLLEQRSFEWFGPTLYIATKLITEYPDIIDLVVDAIANCAKRMTVRSDSAVLKFNVICEVKNDEKKVELNYEGSLEGLKELKEILKEVVNGK
ncbi:hypothetical protein [Yersinia frederiksenii]|uniref:hypothetical protein n=1 Tax=Yersinia frederiksenii TaxID=29484 RepID=UPI0011A0B8C8|nr:hypothetical protein [Yersinia frederiksenii]